jgi:hypothetical protein
MYWGVLGEGPWESLKLRRRPAAPSVKRGGAMPVLSSSRNFELIPSISVRDFDTTGAPLNNNSGNIRLDNVMISGTAPEPGTFSLITGARVILGIALGRKLRARPFQSNNTIPAAR